jgi:hypothetical protein
MGWNIIGLRGTVVRVEVEELYGEKMTLMQSAFLNLVLAS